MSEPEASQPAERVDNRRRPRVEVTRDILDIEEAAELLGVSVKTFNKVLHREDMPARKIGREWKFSRQALIDWVGSGKSRDFYREADADDDEATPEREITPAARRTETNHAPTESSRSRRTAGWQIED